jgi:hypothetical protein
VRKPRLDQASGRSRKAGLAAAILDAIRTEPGEAAKATRHFSNLFEAPVLFYVASVTAIATRQVTLMAVLLAWAYVVLRVVHAYIHLGANRLRQRIPVYFASWVTLLALWITIAWGTALASL